MSEPTSPDRYSYDKRIQDVQGNIDRADGKQDTKIDLAGLPKEQREAMEAAYFNKVNTVQGAVRRTFEKIDVQQDLRALEWRQWESEVLGVERDLYILLGNEYKKLSASGQENAMVASLADFNVKIDELLNQVTALNKTYEGPKKSAETKDIVEQPQSIEAIFKEWQVPGNAEEVLQKANLATEHYSNEQIRDLSAALSLYESLPTDLKNKLFNTNSPVIRQQIAGQLINGTFESSPLAFLLTEDFSQLETQVLAEREVALDRIKVLTEEVKELEEQTYNKIALLCKTAKEDMADDTIGKMVAWSMGTNGYPEIQEQIVRSVKDLALQVQSRQSEIQTLALQMKQIEYAFNSFDATSARTQGKLAQEAQLLFRTQIDFGQQVQLAESQLQLLRPAQQQLLLGEHNQALRTSIDTYNVHIEQNPDLDTLDRIDLHGLTRASAIKPDGARFEHATLGNHNPFNRFNITGAGFSRLRPTLDSRALIGSKQPQTITVLKELGALNDEGELILIELPRVDGKETQTAIALRDPKGVVHLQDGTILEDPRELRPLSISTDSDFDRTVYVSAETEDFLRNKVSRETDTRVVLRAGIKETQPIAPYAVGSFYTLDTSQLQLALRSSNGEINLTSTNGTVEQTIDAERLQKESAEQGHDVLRSIDQNPLVQNISQQAGELQGNMQNMQLLLSTAVSGEATAANGFVGQLHDYARPMLAILEDPTTKANVVQMKEQLTTELARVQFGQLRGTGMESEIQSRINALDDYLGILDDTALLNNVQTAMKIRPNTWEAWRSKDGLIMLAAIIAAVVIIAALVVCTGGWAALAAPTMWAATVGTGLGASAGSATTIGGLAISATGAAGGLIGAEGGKELLYQYHHSAGGADEGEYRYTDGSRMGNYFRGEKLYDAKTGEFVDMDFLKDVASPYAQEFLISFTTSTLSMGAAGLASQGLNKLASLLRVHDLAKHSQLANVILRQMSGLSDEAARLPANLRTIVGVQFKQVLDELVDENVWERGASAALGSFNPKLAFLASFMVGTAKGFKPLSQSEFTYDSSINNTQAVRDYMQQQGHTITSEQAGVFTVQTFSGQTLTYKPVITSTDTETSQEQSAANNAPLDASEVIIDSKNVDKNPNSSTRFITESLFGGGSSRSETGVAGDYSNHGLTVFVYALDRNLPADKKQKFINLGIETKLTYDQYLQTQIDTWNSAHPDAPVSMADPAMQELRNPALDQIVESISATDTEAVLVNKMHQIATLMFGANNARTLQIDTQIGYNKVAAETSQEQSAADNAAIKILQANPTDLVPLKNYLKQNNIDASTRATLVTEVLLAHQDTVPLAANPDQLQAIITAVEVAHNKPGSIDTGTTLENTAKLGVIYDTLLEQGIEHEQALIIAKRFTDAGLAGKPSEQNNVELTDGVTDCFVNNISLRRNVQVNPSTFVVGQTLSVTVINKDNTTKEMTYSQITDVQIAGNKITVSTESNEDFVFIFPKQKPVEATRGSRVIPATETRNWQNSTKQKNVSTITNEQLTARFVQALDSRNLKMCADAIAKDIHDAGSAAEWIIASADMNNPKFLKAANKTEGSDAVTFQRSVVDSFASKPETMRAEIVGTLVEQGQVDLAKRLAKTFKNEGAFNIVDYGSKNAPTAVGRALASIADTEFKRDARAPLEAKMKAEHDLVTLAIKARDAIAKVINSKTVTYDQIANVPSVVTLKKGIVEYQKRHGNGDLDPNLRSALASTLLNTELGAEQQGVLQTAHEQAGAIDHTTPQQAFAKGRALMAGENAFTRLQAKLLLDAGLAGNTLPPPPGSKNRPDTIKFVTFKDEVRTKIITNAGDLLGVGQMSYSTLKQAGLTEADVKAAVELGILIKDQGGYYALAETSPKKPLPPPPALRNNPVNNAMSPRYPKGNLPPPPGISTKEDPTSLPLPKLASDTSLNTQDPKSHDTTSDGSLDYWQRRKAKKSRTEGTTQSPEMIVASNERVQITKDVKTKEFLEWYTNRNDAALQLPANIAETLEMADKDGQVSLSYYSEAGGSEVMEHHIFDHTKRVTGFTDSSIKSFFLGKAQQALMADKSHLSENVILSENVGGIGKYQTVHGQVDDESFFGNLLGRKIDTSHQKFGYEGLKDKTMHGIFPENPSTEKAIAIIYTVTGTEYRSNLLIKNEKKRSGLKSTTGESLIGNRPHLYASSYSHQDVRDAMLEDVQIVHDSATENKDGNLDYKEKGRVNNTLSVKIILPESQAKELFAYLQSNPQDVRTYFIGIAERQMSYHFPPPFAHYDERGMPMRFYNDNDAKPELTLKQQNNTFTNLDE